MLMGESETRSVMSNSLRPHELYSPWNSPGQNTGPFIIKGVNNTNIDPYLLLPT